MSDSTIRETVRVAFLRVELEKYRAVMKMSKDEFALILKEAVKQWEAQP